MDNEPSVSIFSLENVSIVVCPFCGRRIRCPFAKRMYWTREDLLIRRWETHCGIRMIVPRGRGTVVQLPEWWEGILDDHGEPM